MKYRIFAVLAALFVWACSPSGNNQQSQQAPTPGDGGPPGVVPGTASGDIVHLQTVYGRVVIKLRPDLAPNHVARIKRLTNEGFYNGVKFHRVIEGFMAQTGDPTGTGTGGSKYPDLKAEFTRTPFNRGIVGMARARSRDSANSQFFIVYGDANFLNEKYTVVGEVKSGMKFVDQLKKGEPPANPDIIVKMELAGGAS